MPVSERIDEYRDAIQTCRQGLKESFCGSGHDLEPLRVAIAALVDAHQHYVDSVEARLAMLERQSWP